MVVEVNGNAVGASALLEAGAPGVSSPAPAVEPKPSPETDSGFEAWTVPLAQVDAEGSPFRFRRAIKPDAKLKELAASIDAQGLIHPLTVRRKGDLFELVSGFRRHAALSFLARTKRVAPSAYPVKVSVLPEGTSDDEALRVSFAENLARKSLDATEKAIALVKLRDEFGKSDDEIGSILGLSRAHLDRLKDLLVAPADVREAFRSGRFSLRHALALAKVADAASREALIRRSGVKFLRGDKIASAAADAGGDAPDPLPEKVRAFARFGRTADAAFPFRVTVRLRTEDDVARLGRFLLRLG
ncbi:MAG TPA: ParB/RepB/Spo0J family partition protein [Planctomycetota bacterium]|nr:ParB/RepB/Spo0J family partition protein [Planctomycetota bacterium]